MRGSFKKYNNRPMGDRVLDLYYLDQILMYQKANKEDDFIINNLNISKEKYETYKNRLKNEGRLE